MRLWASISERVALAVLRRVGALPFQRNFQHIQTRAVLDFPALGPQWLWKNAFIQLNREAGRHKTKMSIDQASLDQAFQPRQMTKENMTKDFDQYSLCRLMGAICHVGQMTPSSFDLLKKAWSNDTLVKWHLGLVSTSQSGSLNSYLFGSSELLNELFFCWKSGLLRSIFDCHWHSRNQQIRFTKVN